MCLDILSKREVKSTADVAKFLKERIQTAEYDILVYKAISEYDISPYRRFKYDQGFHYYQIGMKFYVAYSITLKKCRVEDGLHSTTTKAAARIYKQSRRCKIRTFIIPKGSKYYIGTCNELVSDNLIYPTKQMLKDYIKGGAEKFKMPKNYEK